LDILKPVLTQNGSASILDIGCALGDFTIRAWQLNPKNQFWGIDISPNAVDHVSRKYPQIRSAVAALPKIPFQEGSFDCIICLEVLYYLDSKDRRQAVEDIYCVMREGGVLLFSVVLDDGARYFAEDDAIQLISQYFDVQQIAYNYGKLYTAIEQKLMTMRSRLITLRRTVEMSSREYEHWQRGRQPNLKLRALSCFKRIVSTIPPGRETVCGCLRLSANAIISLLGWQFLPAWFYRATEFVLRDKGATHIIILAKKRDVSNGYC